MFEKIIENSCYKLIKVDDFINLLKLRYNKEKIFLKELLFDDCLDGELVECSVVIDRLKKLDVNSYIMVKDKSIITCLEIVKIQKRICGNNIRIPENNINDIPKM